MCICVSVWHPEFKFPTKPDSIVIRLSESQLEIHSSCHRSLKLNVSRSGRRAPRDPFPILDLQFAEGAGLTPIFSSYDSISTKPTYDIKSNSSQVKGDLISKNPRTTTFPENGGRKCQKWWCGSIQVMKIHTTIQRNQRIRREHFSDSTEI